ncbi:UvrD-helicase domain-containing protein [Candidatus Omnitrophota bacterium]
MSQNKTQFFSFPEVRIVEASAGSGKTYALAKRYVQLLLNCDPTNQIPIRHILALTFTNKAAFEMKARILEFLKSIALGVLDADQLDEMISPLGIEPEVARCRAFAAMETIIRHYNFFQVQTIDKFINAMLSGCALKIGLTANFKIKTNVVDYLEYSLECLLDAAGGDQDLQKMFSRFINNYLYLENRSGWFPKNDMLLIISNLFYQLNTYGMDFKESGIEADVLMGHKKKLLKSIQTLHGILPEGVDKRFKKSLDKFIEKSVKGFDVDSVSDYFARETLPVNKGCKIPEECAGLWECIGADLKVYCEGEAYALFDPYVQIFSHVLNEFYRLSADDDVLFLPELNRRTRSLFDEQGITVEELYYRLASRFHHYLIDEFQDTSRLQWQNIAVMPEEALSTGGSLFYVGDKKQAIYSFRGGDVSLFEEIKEEYQAFNVQVEALKKNWRSQKNVVTFNNIVFSPENIMRFICEKESFEVEKKRSPRVEFAQEDFALVDLFYGHAAQEYQEDKDQGAIRIEVIDGDKRKERDEDISVRLVERIKEVQTRFEWKDIAILTRSNAQVESVTTWLLDAGIPTESERTSHVRENHLIVELVYFLKFLNTPIDNRAFAAFLFSDLFCQASGLSCEEMQSFVFNCRSAVRNEKDSTLYAKFKESFPIACGQLIEPFLKHVGLYPLYEFVISIYEKYDCLTRFVDNQGFLMHFLELIKQNEDERYDLALFIEYFDALEGEDAYVVTPETNAVRILTVHKSKGLEFPVVFLPFLGMDVVVGASKDNQQSYILEEGQEGMSLFRLKKKYYKFSETLYLKYRREYIKSFLSELNSVYVALTRACHEIHAFIPKKMGNSFNMLKFLIPDELYTCGDLHQYSQIKKGGASVVNLSPSRYFDWMQYLHEEFLAYDQCRHRAQRLKGEVLHFCLSCVETLEDALDEQINKVIETARAHFPSFKGYDALRDQLKNVLSSKALAPLFTDKSAIIFNEREIVDKYGNSRRLDRLMVWEDKVWVIDFKSTQEGQDEQLKQVKHYLHLVEELYPSQKIEGYLVFCDEGRLQRIVK